MSTLEKMFAQIFDRKDSIINQMQQQSDSYTHHLASTLLLDGLTPPPWLLTPSSSDPNELEREKIISKLLLRDRNSTRFSTGEGSRLCSQPVGKSEGIDVRNEPVVVSGDGTAGLNRVAEVGGNVELATDETGDGRLSVYAAAEQEMTLECVFNSAPELDDFPSKGKAVPETTVECRDKDTGCDDGVESPQNETEARISSIYAAAPDTSVARIQRSKSRQKALELRSNVKINAKSCLGNENRTRISFSGDSKSKEDIRQGTQDKCLSEEKGEKENNRTSHSGALANSSSCYEKPSLENELTKKGPSSDKENLDGGVTVQPAGDSLQQYGHVSGVSEGVNLPDICLGSYASKKSRVGKKQVTHSQNNPFSGRVTRSRSSSQQTSGIHMSSNMGSSVSCNPKVGEGAISHSVGDMVLKVNGGNKLLDAVETSQVLSDKIGDTQAICSNGGVLKPVISSNKDMKESSLGGNHQKDAEIVVRNGPIDAPVIIQPVNSGIKLDQVSSDYCMKVKPKQLNFDEISDLNEVCSPLSKRIKLDGLLRQESYPSKESSPLIDNNSSSSMFKQQLSKENVLSNSPKAAMTGYYNNNEYAEDEMMNIGLEMIENPVVEDVEHNSEVSLHDDMACDVNISSKEADNTSNEVMHLENLHLNEDHTSSLYNQVEEDDLSYKGKESAAGVSIQVSQKSKSSFISSLTKQGNKDFEVDLGSSKSKDFEVGTNLKLPEISSSAKFNTCPLNQQKNVEYQPNCFSDSRKFRIPIQRDAICLNLKTPEYDFDSIKESALILSSEKINLSQPDGIQSFNKSFQNTLMGDLPEGTESFYELLAVESDLGHNGKESTAGISVPVSQSSKSPCISSLTKQGIKDFEVGIGSSKSKEFRFGTNSKLSNMKLNSAKFHTYPLNLQKNVEYEPNCSSDSQRFRIPIQRDAIHLNLKTPENDVTSIKDSASILSSEKINVSQSNGIQSCDNSCHETTCDLPEGTESLHELHVAEATVAKVDDDTTATTDTPKQSEPIPVLNAKKNAADVGPVNPIINDDIVVTDNRNFETDLEWVSSYDSVQPSQNDNKFMVTSDEITPFYEGFTLDEEIGNFNMENNEGGVDFDTLEIPSTSIARASIIEQLCISASTQTPLSELSSSYKQNQVQDFYRFMADGNHTSGSCITETDSAFLQHQKLSYNSPFYWQSKTNYSPPTGKLWERSASSSSSSKKKLSSNPDLTCFPIEENEESGNAEEVSEEMNDDLQGNIILKAENENLVSASPETQNERSENDNEVAVENQKPPLESTKLWSQHANPVSTQSLKFPDRYSSNSVSNEASVPRTRDKVKYKPKIPHRFKVSTYDDENRNSSIVTRASSRGNVSVISKNNSSTRSGILRLSQKEATRNNIVSNMTSFIPIVQQKQAAAVCPVKRDIKVKALEAAEAAKRHEQDKENERRLKKEALKVERARIMVENAKEEELNLIKKQEALKKKEADIAARKRLREEEDRRKQLARKRKLVAEAQKHQKIKSENLRTRKVETEKHVKNAPVAGNKRKPRQSKNTDENSVKKQDIGLRTDKTLANGVQPVISVLKNHDASNDCGEKEKATSIRETPPLKVGPVKLTSQGNSYDISPYQCSDDEDDEGDDQPNKKFVPSWASKSSVAMVLPLQQKLDPKSIFPVDSFCNINEVLLPRRLHGQ